MKKLNILYKYINDPGKGILVKPNKDLKEFTTDLLNIGNLETPSYPIEVLAVMFDLEGFTTFTRQVDPRLAIPRFVSEFFSWLFEQIKTRSLVTKKAKLLWSELPFFSKFLGDGALFLWKIDMKKIIAIDTKLSADQINEMTQLLICNIVALMHDICVEYEKFLKAREMNYVDPPKRLRCGIARGDAFPLGANKDFVGPCINIASRLQKFHGLSFGVSARGIDHTHLHPYRKKDFVKKRVAIRGIGDNEIIYVRADEFKDLPEESKKETKIVSATYNKLPPISPAGRSF